MVLSCREYSRIIVCLSREKNTISVAADINCPLFFSSSALHFFVCTAAQNMPANPAESLFSINRGKQPASRSRKKKTPPEITKQEQQPSMLILGLSEHCRALKEQSCLPPPPCWCEKLTWEAGTAATCSKRTITTSNFLVK